MIASVFTIHLKHALGQNAQLSSMLEEIMVVVLLEAYET